MLIGGSIFSANPKIVDDRPVLVGRQLNLIDKLIAIGDWNFPVHWLFFPGRGHVRIPRPFRSCSLPRRYHVKVVAVEARRAAPRVSNVLECISSVSLPCGRSQCSTAFRRACHFLHVCPPGSLVLPCAISCPRAHARNEPMIHEYTSFVIATAILIAANPSTFFPI